MTANGDEVCAIVCTFHPDEAVLMNIATLRPQVTHLVVVDNGSTRDAVAALRAAGISLGFEVIENHKNLGIATALNIGVRRSRELQADWIFLFDQDSRVTDGFADAMLRGYTTSRWGERLALLTPRYVDMRTGSPLPRLRLASGGLEVAITSGNLLRRETFDQQGLFVDEMFIDGVDHEYSLRLRSAGLVLDECEDAVLLHSPASPLPYRAGGKTLFSTTNYAAIRRYYQERNKFWIYRHYLSRYPGFCARLFLGSWKEVLKILFVESGKRRKLEYFLRGVLDGVRGRMGRLDGE